MNQHDLPKVLGVDNYHFRTSATEFEYGGERYAISESIYQSGLCDSDGCPGVTHDGYARCVEVCWLKDRYEQEFDVLAFIDVDTESDDWFDVLERSRHTDFYEPYPEEFCKWIALVIDRWIAAGRPNRFVE